MPLRPKDSKYRTISITLLETLAKELDSYAFLNGKARSHVIAEAVAHFLDLR